ncbi:hypothetical protein VE04_00763 [Pseudogymnoascus sp. 24MN13]|nr:hypothetical protein VE04_00763 [Pseudogymnoascus sp. 24MN13]
MKLTLVFAALRAVAVAAPAIQAEAEKRQVNCGICWETLAKYPLRSLAFYNGVGGLTPVLEALTWIAGGRKTIKITM